MARERERLQMEPRNPGRRHALKVLGSAAGCAALLEVGGLVGCAPAEQPITAIELPLDELPVGERVRVMIGDTPVELLRSEEGIRARSLWCTHIGCEVIWQEEKEEYFCPCHDGRYDSRGGVVQGPPPAPLKSVPVEIRDSVVIVGETVTGG